MSVMSSGSIKEKLAVVDETVETETEDREVFLREGRKLTVSDAGSDQLVEIRNESGSLELRVKLTEQGPILQMDSVRISLKATESVEIESRKVTINGTEQLQLQGGEVSLEAERDVKLNAHGEVRIVGTMIYLN